MIDVGFNLLSWAVFKRKSIRYIDKSLQRGVAKKDPYAYLRIKSSTDSMDGKWIAIDLAHGMNMKDAQLFQQKNVASELINRIISQRTDDETCIEGDAYIDDENTCLAEISIDIMSKSKSLQMTIECQVLDLIYPTREINQMSVRFYAGEKEIRFDINPADINAESFFAALGSKDDCRLFIDGCRMFASGPSVWAAHLREVQGDGVLPWKKTSRGRRGGKKVDLGFEFFEIPKFSSHTMYQASFENEDYGIDFYAGSNTRWSLKSNWTDKFTFRVSWAYCYDYMLLLILENDYPSYDWMIDDVGVPAIVGEDLPSKPLSLETSDLPAESRKLNEEQLRKRAEKQAWKKRREKALLGIEDLTIDNTIERPIEHVHINDLIVRSSVRTCWYKNHEIREVIAIVCVFDPKKGVTEVAVDAFCCPQCKRYYVLQKVFDKLQSKGALCCKIITRPGVQYDFVSQNALGLSDQSIYNSLGYNVNAEEDLSPQERRAVLDFIIENRFRTQKQTIEFLEGRINYNGRRPNMEKAVEKWESDIEYLIHNKGKKVERVRIDRIFLTEHTKW